MKLFCCFSIFQWFLLFFSFFFQLSHAVVDAGSVAYLAPLIQHPDAKVEDEDDEEPKTCFVVLVA